LYKVLSRALNNRLKKLRGYIFSRSQKGFTTDRHIQEVLINVIEMIAHCKTQGINGAILSIDQAKAFDTVSHKFMRSVYKFFGFGQNFIKILETLGNNRSACIGFEDGSHSPTFDLGRGRAQGNTTSPIEYNMAQQIVLFKIELCPEIRSVYFNHFISRPYLPVNFPSGFMEPTREDLINPKFRNECCFETSKCDSFADDNTTGTLLEFESLNALKNVLNDFEEFSGLKCNTEKTVLMPIGTNVPITNEISELGFDLKNSIHILGMDIDREVSNLDSNFERTIQSIKRQIEHWNRYNLTIPGKINIVKSLLFSQILYIGCFLMPSKQKLNEIQKILDDFVTGTMNFSRTRITLPVEWGGLGLFNVEEFLTAQQSNWILRAKKSLRDNWRQKLSQLCNGNVLAAGPYIIDERINPILHGLARSFQKIRICHDTQNKNYLKATIYNNNLFFRGPGNKRVLTLTH